MRVQFPSTLASNHTKILCALKKIWASIHLAHQQIRHTLIYSAVYVSNIAMTQWNEYVNKIMKMHWGVKDFYIWVAHKFSFTSSMWVMTLYGPFLLTIIIIECISIWTVCNQDVIKMKTFRINSRGYIALYLITFNSSWFFFTKSLHFQRSVDKLTKNGHEDYF